MALALIDRDLTILVFVDQTILSVDPAAPFAVLAFERFRLALSLEGVSADFFQQRVDLL